MMGEQARLRIQVSGAVQGVGFRPFVYRLARSLGLRGWVRNTPAGVRIEAEGDPAALRDLLLRLRRERPAAARIRRIAHRRLPPRGGGSERLAGFRILQSRRGGPATALVTPDLSTCAECLRELFDPADRRHRYPFLNCTRCGPRFSIIESLPYDRPRTTMRRFTMCPRCQAEYDDPRDRRFHAQPNACPACGPALALWGAGGAPLAVGDAALGQAAEALRGGAVVAVKGLGGFHLFVDACDEQAVRRLRRRKARPDKPLALMFPDLGQVRARCRVTRTEARLLRGRAAPIVLLRRRPGLDDDKDGDVAASVAPGSSLLGAMLPYTPLHHLLLRDLGRPLVATSGNRAGEPLCIDEHQALDRLRGVADLFLVHDRPIARPVDDSVARVVAGRPLVCRRARGHAPLPVLLPAGAALPEGVSVLGLGAQQKGAVALARGGEALLGQHLGDLDTPEALSACAQSAATLLSLHGRPPAEVACDLHPDYASTRLARELARGAGARVIAVQHHHAHALACLMDNGEAPPALGVAWDGAGLGTDGTIWGGEFLLVRGSTFTRLGHLRTFPLPGGDAAAREPRRAALGALYEVHGEALFDDLRPPLLARFSEVELRLLRQALRAGVACPRTSSAGRLFDALAALLGLSPRTSFEAQAAMALEDAAAAVDDVDGDEGYPFSLGGPGPSGAMPGMVVVDWAPLLNAAQEDLGRGVALSRIAARCHRALTEMIVAVAALAGQERVALCGGCFQNRLLLERTVRRLREAGLRPLWPRRVPPGDNGVALGQVCCAALRAAGR